MKTTGKRICALALSMLTILLMAGAPALADIPKLVNYTGYLTDAGGNPLGGSGVPETVSITFSLYTALEGGSPVWSVTRPVDVTNGVFSVNLGELNALNIDFASPYYLGINVNGDGEMTPRQAFTAAPYALNAERAENVGDGVVQTINIADDAVTAAKIGNNQITQAHIANGGVGTSEIADGSIQTADIADGAITTAKIAPNIVSSVDGVTNDGGNIDLIAGSGVTITPNDGANTITITATGSGDADTLGGEGPSFYRNASNLNAGTLNTGRYSAYSDLSAEGYLGDGSGDIARNDGVRQVNLNADRLDGYHASSFALSGHTHTVSQILSIPGEAFQPYMDVAYLNSDDGDANKDGGAFLLGQGDIMVAPVFLPNGAAVTKFTIFVWGTGKMPVDVYLRKLEYAVGGYSDMALLSSDGGSPNPIEEVSTTDISNETITNDKAGYLIYATAPHWSQDVQIMGVVIDYSYVIP
jgi:hypothetical protein